nr:immunoglobulin heavy chain junction region [Macaca mulatta]
CARAGHDGVYYYFDYW